MIEKIALDAQSKRTYDENGFLHVSISPLTRVQVAPYRGCEIPGWQELGLEPERVYRGYRPASELSKPETIESVNGIPIQLAHHMDYADNPAKNTRVGSTGTDGAFHSPFLTNSLHIQDKNAIDRINDGSMRELSLAYRYKPVFQPGETPDGEKYDFVMTDISANHVALVDEGRAGHEVLVYDSKGGFMADNVDKTLPAADDDAVEKKEVALAEQVKQGAQKLIDLHTSPAEQEPHEEAVGDDDKDAEITSILEDLQKAGADLSKVPGLADRLKGLAAAAADEDEDLEGAAAADEDEDEPAAPAEDPAAAPAEDEEEDEPAEDEDEPAAETDEGDMVADGLKACGLDGEDPEVQKAFAAGLKYAKGGKPEEKPAAAQDRALRKIVSIVSGRLNAKLNAAEECRKTLGRVKLAAFDSAGDIYRAALRQEGFKTKGLSNSEAMKVYRAVIATKAGRRGAAMDRKMQKKPSFLGEILNSINKE